MKKAIFYTIKPENKYPALTAGLIQALRIDGTFPASDPKPAFPCSCGKGLRSAEALKAHKLALGCKNSTQRKRAARQRRLRREGKRK